MKTQGNQTARYICFIPMTPLRHLQLLAVTAYNGVLPISLPKITKPTKASWNPDKPKPQVCIWVGIFTLFLSPANFSQKIQSGHVGFTKSKRANALSPSEFEIKIKPFEVFSLVERSIKTQTLFHTGRRCKESAPHAHLLASWELEVNPRNSWEVQWKDGLFSITGTSPLTATLPLQPWLPWGTSWLTSPTVQPWQQRKCWPPKR